MTTSYSYQKSLILRALVLAFFVNLPSTYLYFQTQALSPLILNDWDESYYLAYAIKVGSHSLSDFFKLKNGNLLAFEPSNYFYPHNILDALIGKLSFILNLTPAQLGIGLDYLCFLLAYFTVYYLFLQFQLQSTTAESATICTLCFPFLWITIPNWLALLMGATNKFLALISYHPWPALPIQRAIYTQVSYPLFALALALSLRGIFRRDTRKFLWGALATSLLVYAYFFAWIAAIIVLAISSLSFAIFASRGKTYRLPARDYFLYILVLGLVALPAILAVHLLSLHNQLEIDANYLRVFGVSASSIAAFIATIITIRSWKSDASATNLAKFGFVLVATDFLALNIQGIVQIFIAPYHVATFYVLPLLSGTSIALIARSWLSSQTTRHLLNILFSIAVLSAILKLQTVVIRSDLDSEIELLTAIRKHTEPESKIAVLPFVDSFNKTAPGIYYSLLPYWIEALTGRIPFLAPINDYSTRQVGSELVLGFIFSEEIQAVASCKIEVKKSTEILIGSDTYTRVLRANVCKYIEKAPLQQLACEAYQSNPFDYVVWNKSAKSETPKSSAITLQPLWQNEGGIYSLYKVSRSELKRKLCATN